MNNPEFLKAISNSFHEFLCSGTSRSTAKLKPLHGAIARDFSQRLGKEFTVHSQGFGKDKEKKIQGRYINKAVDITICKDNKAVAGIAVKFVMQNYSQNSNNYFENMLGETANIRSNKCPYFQLFIILDQLPYYNQAKDITRWETFTAHNVEKYVVLSHDDVEVFFHTPNKTLVYVVHLPEHSGLSNREEYISFYKAKKENLQLSPTFQQNFGSSVILNDYELFAQKVYHTIMAM